MSNQPSIKLTQYSKGAGCGCKIAPNVLEQILKTNESNTIFKNLLVGNETNDDAAVYDLENGNALISTTDFFMPIVDDAFTFGQVAAANAISDVYAMGGSPIMALAILGLPIEKIPIEVAQQILDGARNICTQANIPLAGGHSIDSADPIFGLSVNGIIEKQNLKTNNLKNSSTKNNLLYITKPLGVGIISTAQKREKLEIQDEEILYKSLTQLNKIGEELGKLNYVNALTDITGFGLLGHALEMIKDTELSIEFNYNNIPILEPTKKYLAQQIIPDATYRNWNSYKDFVKFETGVNVMEAFSILPDPQTNGGLLIAINEKNKTEFEAFIHTQKENSFWEIGKTISFAEKSIIVA